MNKFLVLILVMAMILTGMTSCKKGNSGNLSSEKPDIDIGDYSNDVTVYKVDEYK